MSGHGDIPMTVRAMKGGAVDFLTKPFRDQDMLDAVGAAIERDRKRRETEKALSDLRARLATLTPRERDIFSFCFVRAHEQTDSCRVRSCRNHCENPPKPYHEKNGREVAGRIGETGRSPWHFPYQGLSSIFEHDWSRKFGCRPSDVRCPENQGLLRHKPTSRPNQLQNIKPSTAG